MATSVRTPDLNHPAGRLVIIGGHEEKDKDDNKEILSTVSKFAGNGKLVVATVASEDSIELWKEYRKIFGDLGVEKLAHLNVNSRDEAFSEEAFKALKDAKGIFFTGGDQLRITSDLGGTVLCQKIHEIYAKGGFIAGTSAGASVMSDTMMVSGPSDKSVRTNKSVVMAPGLGFLKDFIVDQHFSERGRLSRLIAAVASNPKYLGLGIDENTAVVIENSKEFHVIGNGAVYVVNGESSTHSNISESHQENALSAHNLRVDVLCRGEKFDIPKREPKCKTLDQKEMHP